ASLLAGGRAGAARVARSTAPNSTGRRDSVRRVRLSAPRRDVRRSSGGVAAELIESLTSNDREPKLRRSPSCQRYLADRLDVAVITGHVDRRLGEITCQRRNYLG